MKILLLVIIIIAGGFFFFNQKTSKKSICPLNNTNIITIGDSLANGFGINNEDSFAIQIPKKLNKNATKRGIDGETTSGLLQRIDSELNKNNIAAIIISIGGNDILRNINKEKTKQNLDLIVKKAKEKTSCVVLLGVPDGVLGSIVGNVSPIYNEIANKYNVLLESSSMPKILKSSSLKVDQIHPNKEGHSMIADNIVGLIKRNK
ncbi:GDSL-type esterase/lipase family protein [Helicobacter sp. MIT 14-3879]|uniref:GDSL-type esterase/lipase family protein n=1 Tax=Helicobacter sp. MIT 14-3879 TaxID=2040649 RepID=UPI0015F1BC32|nr:GDSL-type esterase/lipase family protein [Helicobacter sp. MIT 14-3879]